MCSLEIKKREQRWAKYLTVSKENKKKTTRENKKINFIRNWNEMKQPIKSHCVEIFELAIKPENILLTS